MFKYNAAIYLLSSRTALLYECLEKFYKHWNSKYNYPVYVHYYNNIYSKKFIKKINKEISDNIHFKQIDFEIPKNINDNEIFYNRKYNRYVIEQFPKKRLGYLHMERFVTNITSFGQKGCLCNDLEKFDYLMRIDDDSNFKKNIDFDFFDVMKNYNFATGYTWNNVTWRQISTRENLWNFYKKYLKKSNVFPINKILKDAYINDQESNMHDLQWSAGNLNIYNMIYFKNSSNWKEYLIELNEYAGDYKYRWGDIETIGLFAYTYFQKPIYDFKLIEKGLYSNKFDSIFSSTAPSVNSFINIHKFPLLRIYHYFKKIFNK